ncbi:hypothetical protein LX32DRAFT_40361 [Colletotrichum zoysiae]|uniref:Uncharacterized protein n=1 Tax=Colletotrichum zoysiae TaxID=1216348 RepID=A0AAD9HBC5_9PEZI|nr:hypothetical protein LX32DRAFT_40361 [Colletotrichum zoysiae]
MLPTTKLVKKNRVDGDHIPAESKERTGLVTPCDSMPIQQHQMPAGMGFSNQPTGQQNHIKEACLAMIKESAGLNQVSCLLERGRKTLSMLERLGFWEYGNGQCYGHISNRSTVWVIYKMILHHAVIITNMWDVGFVRRHLSKSSARCLPLSWLKLRTFPLDLNLPWNPRRDHEAPKLPPLLLYRCHASASPFASKTIVTRQGDSPVLRHQWDCPRCRPATSLFVRMSPVLPRPRPVPFVSNNRLVRCLVVLFQSQSPRWSLWPVVCHCSDSKRCEIRHI